MQFHILYIVYSLYACTDLNYLFNNGSSVEILKFPKFSFTGSLPSFRITFSSPTFIEKTHSFRSVLLLYDPCFKELKSLSGPAAWFGRAVKIRPTHSLPLDFGSPGHRKTRRLLKVLRGKLSLAREVEC